MIRSNRTGMAAAPARARKSVEGACESEPTSLGDELLLASMRVEYARGASPIGSVPAASASPQQGAPAAVLVDKLSERLAFERRGVRLYEALASKLEASGTYPGGPTREDLEQLKMEEGEHFVLLKELLEALGADATAVTPSADLVAVETQGLVEVLADPRTTLPQGLHAMLLAELADQDGWQSLVDLAGRFGRDELVRRLRPALLVEDRHLADLRAWLEAWTLRAANSGRPQEEPTLPVVP